MISIEEIARVVHQVNKAYCQAIGDKTQVSWEDAPEWQKESAFDGILKIVENPEQTPEQSHEAWMLKKQQDGWRYGPIKDEKLMTHPAMVPYSDLSVEARAKDYIFSEIVKELLAI